MRSSFKAASVAILLLGIGTQCRAALDEVALALESGEPGSAISQLQAMPEHERKSYRGRLLYAAALAEEGKRDEAVKRYQALIEEAPSQPEPYNNLAVLYAAEGQLDKALELLERAMNTSASYATVRDNLGRVYLELSLNSYAKALRVDGREKPPTLQALYALNRMPEPHVETVIPPQGQVAASAPAEAESVAESEPGQGQAVAMTMAEEEEEPAKAAADSDEPEAEAEATEIVAADPAPTAGAEGAPVTLASVVAAASEPEPELMQAQAPKAEPAPMDSQSTELAASQPAAEPVNEPQKAVLSAVQQWAKAWQGQEVETYLSSYAEGFTPSHGLSREQWQAQRRQRLAKPEQIEVVLEGPTVTFDRAGRARVTFLQHYRSDHYQDKTRKRLVMLNDGGKWKILAEKTLEVLR